MPNKLTDAEIKKALENITSGGISPVGKYIITEHTLKDALDLINRQQAENKRLSTLAELGNKRADDYRVMRDRALKAEAENERLFADNQKYLSVMLWGNKKHKKDCIKQIKAEAYKECIEKVKAIAIKKKIVYVADASLQEQEIGWLEIQEEKLDNLLKELGGENK